MAHKYEGPLPPGFELKRCHQPNMLKALGSVTFVAIAIGITMRLTDSGVPQSTMDPAKRRAENQVHVSQVEKPVEKARQQFGSLNPYQKQHQGFAGFNGYKVTHDAPEVRPEKPPKVYALKPSELAVPSDDASYADVPGDSIGIGLPTLDTVEALPPEVDTTTKKYANQPLEVIRAVKPKIPGLAQIDEKAGYVEVYIYVDETGTPRRFAHHTVPVQDTLGKPIIGYVDGKPVALYVDTNESENYLECVTKIEVPEFYNFAENLAAVIPEWRFKPRIVNSKPVGTFAIIQFKYCLPEDYPDNCPQVFISPI